VVWKDLDNNSKKSGDNLGPRMANQDSTLIFLVFHGTGKDDVKQNSFTYKEIWSAKRVTNEVANISQVETMFRDRALTCYMKYKASALAG